MVERGLLTCLRQEVADLVTDPWLLSVVSWVFPVLSVIMWWIFSAGIATDLPIGVVDLDRSQLSRSLVRHYDASSSLAVDYTFLDVRDGAAALRAGRIYGLVIIPAELARDAATGRTPQVAAMVNSQFLLIGKIVSSGLLQAHGTFATRVEVFRNLAGGSPVAEMALAAAIPINTQVTPLFNVGKNYAQFLVSAILPAIWQIVMVSAAVLSLAGVARRQGLAAWLGDSPSMAVAAKVTVLSGIFLFHGGAMLGYMYLYLGWPMYGNWLLLLAAQLLTVVASVGAGCLYFLLTRDAARALSSAAAYVAPGLAFMGVTFPVTDMTLPARIWRSLIPVSHYIEIQFGQVNYGLPASLAATKFLHLGLFAVPLLFTFLLARRFAPCGRGGTLAEAT